MWFDDADVQIIGMCSDDLDLKSKMEINKIVTDFNESMRYKNIIKKQDKAIKQLNNIINELEKYLKEIMESYGYENDITDRIEKIAVKNILNKLKELKNK